jgi:hypothetical protein
VVIRAGPSATSVLSSPLTSALRVRTVSISASLRCRVADRLDIGRALSRASSVGGRLLATGTYSTATTARFDAATASPLRWWVKSFAI